MAAWPKVPGADLSPTGGVAGSLCRGTTRGIREGGGRWVRERTVETGGRHYVVVSADTHASPDDLDQFLSYVDPAAPRGGGRVRRDVVAAISMFGGYDPGEVDESDPVRATAARRLAGMGVDTDAAEDWLERYGTDWVVPGDGDGRRLEVLEEQGIHAEVTLPGPVLAGGLSPAMYLGGHSRQGPRAGVAGAPRLQPLAGRLLRRRAGPAGRLSCRSTSTTWTARSTRSPGPGTRACSAASCCRPCR